MKRFHSGHSFRGLGTIDPLMWGVLLALAFRLKAYRKDWRVLFSSIVWGFAQLVMATLGLKKGLGWRNWYRKSLTRF